MRRPTEQQAQMLSTELGMEFDELAQLLYPKARGYTYDTAIPMNWVQEMQRKGFKHAHQVVWVYDRDHSLLGAPGPLTQEAARGLRDLGEVTI